MTKKKSDTPKKKKEEVAKELKKDLDKAIDKVIDEAVDEALEDAFTEEDLAKVEEIKPMDDKELIEMIKQAALLKRESVTHRELGMALDEFIKSLQVVETWLKTIDDVEADIEKKTKK